MKRLTTILLGLLLTLTANAQLEGVISQGVVSGGYSAEYQAVYDAMTNPPAADTAVFQNTMVVALVAGGFWSTQWDVFYVPANGRLTNAYLNWIAPTGDDNLTIAAATVTFEAYHGFTGDGIAGSISTNWNPSTEGTLYAKDDCTVAAYALLNKNETTVLVGAIESTYPIIALYPRNSGSFQGRLNAATAGATAAVANSLGFSMVTRRASNDLETYRNGSSHDDATTASINIPNTNLTLLSRNASRYSTNTVGIAMAGASVSDADAAAINTIIEAYMDAIGEGVQ